MLSLAQLPFLAVEGGAGELIFLVVAAIAYAVPQLIKWLQERNGTAPLEDGSEPPLPGRRPTRRAPRGGGEFVDPKQAAQRRRAEQRDRWRELLMGEEPVPLPRRRDPVPVKSLRRPEPVESPSPTLVELGESIDELHRTLDRRHEQLDETHSGLPSESVESSLVSPQLSKAPSEDDLETGSRHREAGGVFEAPEVDLTRSAVRTHPHPWRQALVLSELFGAPIALRSPSETPGRMPG